MTDSLGIAIWETKEFNVVQLYRRERFEQNSKVRDLSMSGRLIPPRDLASPSVAHLPLAKRIEIWAELVDESEALLLAGLRAKVGPGGDLQAAYRQWYARHMEEHDRMLAAMCENLSRREAGHGK
jgi:hypothetical protein